VRRSVCHSMAPKMWFNLLCGTNGARCLPPVASRTRDCVFTILVPTVALLYDVLLLANCYIWPTHSRTHTHTHTHTLSLSVSLSLWPHMRRKPNATKEARGSLASFSRMIAFSHWASQRQVNVKSACGISRVATSIRQSPPLKSISIPASCFRTTIQEPVFVHLLDVYVFSAAHSHTIRDTNRVLIFIAHCVCVCVLQGDEIFLYEVNNEEPFIHSLSKNKCTSYNGSTIIPKRSCDVTQSEVMRFLNITKTTIEPVSILVPRKVSLTLSLSHSVTLSLSLSHSLSLTNALQ
jgi:hypothetical protein